MSMTAVAQGADYLITGYGVPVDAGHWETFGEGLRLLQKAGPGLLDAPKVKAKACMLFPRTQQIQLQHEYFNVGLSFECFLRAFGELDILHEEQVTDDTLAGYDLLVLFDVELLPEAVAERNRAFCAKRRHGRRRLRAAFERLSRTDADSGSALRCERRSADRIRRAGHWVPNKTQAPGWANRPENAPDESIFATDDWRGTCLEQEVALTLVSPRPCVVTAGEVLAKTTSGQPALVRNHAGKGRTYLLGFCVQDTYFKTWEDENESARAQMSGVFQALTREARVQPHVRLVEPGYRSIRPSE